jgi:hypothetical protein
MSIISAHYANPEHTALIATTDDRGDVAYSQRDTPVEFAAVIAARSVDEYTAPVIVPSRVTPLQARKALRAANLKTQVDVFIAGLSAEKREEWEYCIEVRRDNALIAAAATSLGLSSSAVDDLFRLAATL